MKIKNKIYSVYKFFLDNIYSAIAHDGVEHAGYLAFLAMLTIFPFLVFFMAIIGMLQDAKLTELLMKLITDSSCAGLLEALKPRILEITSTPPQSFLTIAILSAVWTASSIFEAIRTILNKAYGIKEYPHYILRRLLSFVEFAIVIVIMIVLLVILIVIPSLSSYIYTMLREHDILLEFLSPESESLRGVILIIFYFSFVSGLYYFLPNRKQKLSKTFPGASFVIVGWYFATKGMSYYITIFPSINIIYGSIAGIIVALLYFYICAFIFIIGAEVNCYLEKRMSLEDDLR
jgi:membrane protein